MGPGPLRLYPHQRTVGGYREYDGHLALDAPAPGRVRVGLGGLDTSHHGGLPGRGAGSSYNFV